MWFSKLPCNIGTVPVGTQPIYNFTVRPRGICNSVEFHDTPFTCKFRATKCGEWAGPANQLQWTLILDLRPFRTSKNSFSPTSEVVVCAYKFIFVLTIFAEWTKCHVHMVLFCNLHDCMVPPSQAPEVKNFTNRCYQALSSPCFEERAWEWG